MASAEAAAEEVPADRQAVILTRALAYDANLKGRAGDSIVVAVTFKSGDGASEKMADAVVQAWRAMERVKVLGLPFKVLRLPFTGEAMAATLTSQGIDALYLCAGLERDLAAVKTLSRKLRIITMGALEEHVRNGVALGVFMHESKSTITVNLPATREEGAAFGSDLLRLARVIK